MKASRNGPRSSSSNNNNMNLRRDETSTSGSSTGSGSSSSVTPFQHQQLEKPSASAAGRRGIPMLRIRRQLQLTTSQQQSLPMEGLITTVREHGGYTTMYSCTSNATADIINETTLLFDFEFVLPNPEEPLIEVVTQDFPKVELGILFRMAKITGIYPDCDLTQQLSDRWEKLTDTLQAGKETTRLDQPQFLSEDNLIMGLSSWSPDNVDEVGTCTFIKDFAEGMICVPVVGNMTIYYIGDDKQAIIDYLNHHLREEMNEQRVSLGGPGGVKETYFIGTRERGGKAGDPPPSVQSDTPTTLRASPEGEVRLLPILIAAGVGALFVLFFILFVIRKRSNREQEEEGDFASAVQDISDNTEKQDDQDEASGVDQVESPRDSQDEAFGDDQAATSGGGDGENDGNRGMLILPPPIMRTSGSSSSSASASSTDGIPEEVTTSANTPQVTTADKSEELPSYLPTTIDTSKEVLVPSLASPPATPESKPPSSSRSSRSSGPVSVDILPPLPPGAPSAKVAAAVVPPAAGVRKRRKKKKKKKTAALERTSSRDSINEMETIQEGQESDDNGSDGDSSYGSGSEYSWSTDETDSRASSRDPSPTRLATTGSAVTELASNTTASAATKPPKWV